MANTPLLTRGDLVRIVAPSGAFERGPFEQGLHLLEQAGLKLRFDEGLFDRRLYLAGDDARRLAELETALADPEARGVWIARGGYGAARLLPRLTTQQVMRARRTLVGFSDASALHALWTRAGQVSVHGANVTTLSTWSDAARNELFALLFEAPTLTYEGAVEKAGPTVRGLLWGGNLTVLGSLCGTGALPRLSPSILLLEDVGERPYRLDRTLTQLRQSGALEGVVGLVLGQLTACEEPQGGYGSLDGLREALAGLELPILTGLPLGHEPSSRAVLLGARAELDTSRGLLTVSSR